MTSNREDLDRSLVHGIAWTSMVTWFSQALSWVSTFYVARKLAPDDYGLVGTAGIYLAVVLMLSEFGVGAAVVRFQSLDRDQLGQFNSLSVMLGLGAMVLGVLIAYPTSLFLEEPRLTSVMPLMSIAFVITSFRVVPQAVLQKRMQFRKMALIEGTQSLTMATASITMASLGVGYWTLAIAPLIGAAVGTTLVVINNPMPFRRPKPESIREPFEFSRQTIFTRFAWFAYSNADFLIARKMLGGHAMGLYLMGWQLAGMAVEKVTSLVGRVTPAFFSSLQTNLPELRRYFVLITEGLATITFPACVGLALVAPDLVIVLGPQWESAAFPLQALALLATVRSIDPLVQQAMSAIGEAKLNLQNAILTVCVLPPVFFFAAGGWGIDGIAIAWLICGPVLLSRLWFTALRRLSVPVREYFGALWPATSSCLVMAAVVIGLDRTVLADSPPLTSLMAKAAAGAVTYSATLLVMHRDRVLRVRGVLQTLRSKKAAPAVPQAPA